ncbi:hypothetical protein HPP92_028597 [Vanilla planifolia]|uniref:GYF domain-containing protein n=1 Tax=Vanilla planifolia TaxID=51239 RepID=A0A835P838_VANPL|nr:hypothetical protein HPP92_028597 [Vanilla planifolia]
MLLEHLLRQQLHDPAFGASQVDQLLGNSSLDQMFLRQQLLRELEHQPHHVQRHQDPTLEQLIQANLGYNHHREHRNDLLEAISQQKHRSALSMEEQMLFNLQKDKMQAMQFPHASRLQRGGLEEDRHGGGVWSVDESSQFLRRAAVPNQPHSSRLNQLDFVQTLQQPPLFEHESVLERNLMLHDRMQHAPYETSMKHFDSSISHSPPVPNSDVLDALARLQGLDVSDVCGRVYPSIQKRQLHPVSSSFEDRAANHYLIPGMDLIDSKWAESNGQLPNNLSEQQLNQLHFMAERQKMDMRGSLFNRESNAWEAFAGNDNPKNGIDELFQQKLALQPSDSFDIAAPSYEDQDSNWFTRSFDSSFKRATEEAALHDSSSEGTITSKLAYFQQDGLKTLVLKGKPVKMMLVEG